MEALKKKRLQIIFLVLGAIGGFLYWRFVGCTSGTCAIKSVWYWSTLWGAAVGYLAGDFLNDLLLKVKKKKETNNDREV
ncbi:DUF6132 family protein [Maribellus sediminis]|uniref:DUF6132 family protein n=1 Tax=Maribellus sediminis TaxID=2696285 RepID=UPI001430D14D|nr:DUF6132 family protein [Maribellus sediminis]